MRSSRALPRATRHSSMASRQSQQSQQIPQTQQTPHVRGDDEGSNIRVVTRCRGRNDREINAKSAVVVDTNSESRAEVSVRVGEDLESSRTYTLDHVFGPDADQAMVFDQVVSPIVDDLINGMNCTVFAYGQTGTGKTFTMSGDDSINSDSYAHDAGIIPRVLFRLFNALESRAAGDYAVNCSFIELYNEELRDLLDPGDGKKVRIYDDSAKKQVMVQGLTESFVSSAVSGLKTLQTGLRKRHTAATKMNDVSSRSHTIFTLNVVIDKGNDECSRAKINLVDLAGSENVAKSGAQNQRAKEAGVINQSLLTLGRVINSLVDKSPHVPYRESKLTRLLQDSLGGRTKTCIIATISPALVNIEETLSTLEYASRAKNIKNKPQTNALAGKKLTLRDYAAAMERMRQDLVATRKKNGIYMDSDNYKEMVADTESQKILVTDQQRKLDTVDGQLKQARELVETTKQQLRGVNKELETNTSGLTSSLVSLGVAEEELEQSRGELMRGVGGGYRSDAIGKDLMDTMDQTINEVKHLSNKLSRKYEYEQKAKGVIDTSSVNISSALGALNDRIKGFTAKQSKFSKQSQQMVKSVTDRELTRIEEICAYITKSSSQLDEITSGLKQHTSGSNHQMQAMVENVDHVRDDIKSRVREGLNSLSHCAVDICTQIHAQVDEFEQDVQQPLEAEVQLMHKRVAAEKQRADQAKQEMDRLYSAMRDNAAHAASHYQAQIAQLTQQLETERRKSSQTRDAFKQQVMAMFDEQEEAEKRVDEQVARLQPLSANDALAACEPEYKQVYATIEQSGAMAQSASTRTVNLLTQVANSTRDKSHEISQTTSKFQTDTASAIDSQVVAVEHNVQALDGFMESVGSQTQLHGEKIEQQVDKACSFYLSMVNNIESGLHQIKRELQVGQTNDNDNDEMTQQWAGVVSQTSQAIDSIHQCVVSLEGLLPRRKRKLEEDGDDRVPLNELPTENLPVMQLDAEEKVANIQPAEPRLRSSKRLRR